MTSLTPNAPNRSNQLMNPVQEGLCQKIQSLLQEMAERNDIRQTSSVKNVSQDQRIRYSLSLMASRKLKLQNRPQFNNKTREGELIDGDLRPNPYHFIPGYKNNTFIMPNRVFEKGNAGKRFIIKMKDSSIYSFRDSEPERALKAIRKDQKQETIFSRQNEEYNRIINENDGKVKAQTMRWHLKTRKRTNPVHASEYFSQYDPMMEPKDPETQQTRKISLSKTFDFRGNWRPFTRGEEVFSATVASSPRSHQRHISSVR